MFPILPLTVHVAPTAADLDCLLAKAGVKNLVLTGITTDVCVHTTMRDANDRGFECLLLEVGVSIMYSLPLSDDFLALHTKWCDKRPRL